MGAEEVNVAAVDSGPLIHLAETNALPLLCVFDALHLPDAVWVEAIEQGRVAQEALQGLGIVQQHTLSPSDVDQFIREKGLEHLHRGERECLFLCQSASMSVLLTDDLAVREAAKQLNLTPVGSLGIVVRAYQSGLVTLAEAEQHLTDLYTVSSLFVTRAIVELAIEQLRRHPI